MQSNVREVSGSTLEELLEGLHRSTGYDFSGYSRASLGRRIVSALESFDLPGIPSLRSRIASDPAFGHSLVARITVNVTEMFRDAGFFQSLRTRVVP